MTMLNLGYLTLIDNWPGVVNPNRSIPTDGWDNTVDNIITTVASQTPPVPIGTKIMGYSTNKHAPGSYTMMYLMLHCYSATSDVISETDFSLKGAWCAHCDISGAEKYTTDFSAVPYYVVAKCSTAVASDVTMLGFPIALPCFTLGGDGEGAYVAGYGDAYGWFWVGGVCPLDDVSHFRGTGDDTRGFDFTTDILMRAGPVYFDMTAAQSWLTSCDISESGQVDGTKGITVYPHGFACTSSA